MGILSTPEAPDPQLLEGCLATFAHQTAPCPCCRPSSVVGQISGESIPMVRNLGCANGAQSVHVVADQQANRSTSATAGTSRAATQQTNHGRDLGTSRQAELLNSGRIVELRLGSRRVGATHPSPTHRTNPTAPSDRGRSRP